MKKGTYKHEYEYTCHLHILPLPITSSITAIIQQTQLLVHRKITTCQGKGVLYNLQFVYLSVGHTNNKYTSRLCGHLQPPTILRPLAMIPNG